MTTTPEQSTSEQQPAEPTDRLFVLDGRDALAFVIIRPADDDPERIAVEASARGISKAVAAYALRQTADQFDAAALAEGDEPITAEEAAAEQQQRAAEQPTAPRILTDDEYETAYSSARSEFGMLAARIGRATIDDALTAAFATIGVLTTPPEPEPDACPAMFADREGDWLQCAEDPGHDPADGHSDGEWSWPDGQTHATPEDDALDAEAQR